MKKCLNQLFVFLSYGVINRGALRLRTQSIFTLFSLFTLLGCVFFVLGLLKTSERAGGLALLVIATGPYFLGKIIDPYVDANWRLFNYRSKEGLRYKALRVGMSWLCLISVILLSVGSIYWWLKRSVSA